MLILVGVCEAARRAGRVKCIQHGPPALRDDNDANYVCPKEAACGKRECARCWEDMLQERLRVIEETHSKAGREAGTTDEMYSIHQAGQVEVAGRVWREGFHRVVTTNQIGAMRGTGWSWRLRG